MKLLAVGDLHLGAGAHLSPDRLAEQRDVWVRACDLAAERGCGAVLGTGDFFHRRRPSPAENLAFLAGLERLRAHGIPFLAIPGNHEVAALDEPTPLDVFARRDLMRLARAPMVWRAHGRPNVAALPWTPPGLLLSQTDGDPRSDVNRVVSTLLLEVARQLRAEAGDLAILLLHWSISGASLPNGQPVSDLPEPVLPLAELAAMGWRAIVAGHIHAPQVLSGIREPPIIYTGSPCVVDWGEAETRHGCAILDTASIQLPPEFVALEPQGRFRTIRIEMPGEGEVGPYDLVDPGFWRGPLQGAEAVRLMVTCGDEDARRLDAAAVRAALAECGARLVSLQIQVERPARRSAPDLDETAAPLDALARYLEATDADPPVRDAMILRTRAYLEEGE